MTEVALILKELENKAKKMGFCLRQRDIAYKIGITPEHLSKLKNDGMVKPTDETLDKLKALLEVN